VLHAQPYRETSLLLQVLTPDYGRVTLVARGARRPASALRGGLLPFQPLKLSWFGKNEVRTLHALDWLGGVPQLSGRSLICGFYLNELLIRLTVRDDPHAETWQVYDRAVRGLASAQNTDARQQAEVLRRFELNLIRCLGYAPQLEQDSDGAAIDSQRYYCCHPGSAPMLEHGAEPPDHVALLSGATLLAMAHDDFSLHLTRREARGLLRLILTELLGSENPLATRELLQSLSQIAD
jgi:DNA repair protein RecO (recombination protein O)